MKPISNYQRMKERARQIAIAWQHEDAQYPYSWEGASIVCNYFETLGRRFGLLREFRENGII